MIHSFLPEALHLTSTKLRLHRSWSLAAPYRFLIPRKDSFIALPSALPHQRPLSLFLCQVPKICPFTCNSLHLKGEGAILVTRIRSRSPNRFRVLTYDYMKTSRQKILESGWRKWSEQSNQRTNNTLISKGEISMKKSTFIKLCRHRYQLYCVGYSFDENRHIRTENNSIGEKCMRSMVGETVTEKIWKQIVRKVLETTVTIR